MSRADLESIAGRWISLWSAPVDWKLFEQLHAEDFVDGSSAGRETHREAFAAALEAFVRAFPDVRTRVEGLVVDEAASRVAVRWSAVGTNRGAYLDVGPTGRRTTITGIEIIGIREGRIARRWGEWDISDHTGRS